MGSQESKHAVVYCLHGDPRLRDRLAHVAVSSGLAARSCLHRAEFLELYDPKRLGCLVTAARLPDGCGIELQEELCRSQRPLPFVFVEGSLDVAMAVRAMRGGAIDVLGLPLDEDLLAARIREATLRAGLDRSRADAQARMSRLSRRERIVLELVVGGSSTKEIASALQRSSKTIEAHRRSILQKLEASNLAEVVRVALTATPWLAAPPALTAPGGGP